MKANKTEPLMQLGLHYFPCTAIYSYTTTHIYYVKHPFTKILF